MKEANRLLRELEGDLVGYIGDCLFVVDDNGQYCNKLVSNNCHIVSESSVLSKLKNRQGKLLELQWGVSQWRRLLFADEAPANIPPFRRPPGATCVGRFACKSHSKEDPYSHDDEFKKIDVAQPDFCDPIVRFLAGLSSDPVQRRPAPSSHLAATGMGPEGHEPPPSRRSRCVDHHWEETATRARTSGVRRKVAREELACTQYPWRIRS